MQTKTEVRALMDRQEFAERVVAQEQILHRVARAMLAREADREDAMQEAVARAWFKRRSLRDERYFATWLTRVLINECKRVYRRQKRLVLMSDWQENALTETAGFAEPSAVDAALDALPESLRLPTVLHYMQGFSVQEVADMLRLPCGTVKSRLFDARKALKLELQSEEVQP